MNTANFSATAASRFAKLDTTPVICLALVVLASMISGCVNPIGADKTTPKLSYRQIHDNPISHGQLSRETRTALHRLQEAERFEISPDETLRAVQQKVGETRERGLLFVLAELNYVTAERLRAGVKPWEPRDARDYYLASAVYAWLFLLGDAEGDTPGLFDERFRTACDLYNYALGWAFTERRSNNGLAVFGSGTRQLPTAAVEIDFKQPSFPWPLADFEQFIVADHYVVRGLSVRNRQSGLGAPLIAVGKPDQKTNLPKTVPVTLLLRPMGGLAELKEGRLRASLELYSAFDDSTVRVNDRVIPLETDTTISTAYALNQSFIWQLGMAQFLSYEEKIPTDVYLTQPYRPGRIPVVFVHGTFSSPVWWAEMANALASDPALRQRYQFWYFIYNSGNPLVYSANRLRESLTAKIRQLDPDNRDAALQQMVIVGHSQGGLLTKLTATDTGDRIIEAVLKTNRLEDLKLSGAQIAAIRRYTSFEALPFVKRVVFVSTPHRGSYLAGNFVRKIARKFVTLPAKVIKQTTELTRLSEKLDFPKELRGTPTSLDSMSPRNPVLLALANIPLAPGIKGNSIIAVEGEGDFHLGRDGLVTYDSAHVDYVESEFIVRSFHSCQDKAPTIEEVRRILHEHLRSLPANTVVKQP